MVQKKNLAFVVAALIASVIGVVLIAAVAQGAEERKLPRLVDQCKASCTTSAKGDAKKQASCDHMCGVIFDGKKKATAQDTGDETPAPTEGDEWRVHWACTDSCQTTLWACQNECNDRNQSADSGCNRECGGDYQGCKSMCDTMFPFKVAK